MLHSQPENLSVAQTKDGLAEIINEVAYHQKRFIVSRHGKPVMGLVPAAEVMNVKKEKNLPRQRQSFLALVGLYPQGDNQIDKMVKHIYKKRKIEKDRPIPDFK